MEKNTILQLAVAATVVISAVAKALMPQPTSLFDFTQRESTPIIKMPDSPEVAVQKAAAIKDLVNSEAFNKALPTAQKQMLTAINELFN